ncbi:hypothetical protein QIW49_03200 [Francisellaceae bacterium CB300]|jgi:hypothetical protein
MKKNLLIPVLTVLFAIPAFSAFPGADMNNAQIGSDVISSNMRPMHGKNRHKDPNDRDRVVRDNQSQSMLNNSETRSSERAYPMHGAKDESEQGSDDRHPPKHHKKAKHNQQHVKAHSNQKNEDDENDNLKDIARPAPQNITNNLRIPSGEDARLNKEMMLNGPQGGFQNNQPRGIGA